jgi:hypothetical protein
VDEEFTPTHADLFNLDPRFRDKTRVLSWEEGTRVLPRYRGGCWEWIGYVNWSGAHKTVPYGRIRRPRAGARASAVYVHKYVWELFFGRYPEGFESHHDCQYTLCFNPSHTGPIDPDLHDEIHDFVRNLGRWAMPGRR